jgi:hypothetical protein
MKEREILDTPKHYWFRRCHLYYTCIVSPTPVVLEVEKRHGAYSGSKNGVTMSSSEL